MNLFGLKIDKLIVLTDKSEEVGSVLLSRPGFGELCNIESELTFTTTITGVLKEAYGDENVKDVGIDGPIDEVFNRLLGALDPFHIRVDDESLVRTPADIAEGDDPITYGDYAAYCPVTLK
jgi:adenylate/nucleoside-diphosphate kinase